MQLARARRRDRIVAAGQDQRRRLAGERRGFRQCDGPARQAAQRRAARRPRRWCRRRRSVPHRAAKSIARHRRHILRAQHRHGGAERHVVGRHRCGADQLREERREIAVGGLPDQIQHGRGVSRRVEGAANDVDGHPRDSVTVCRRVRSRVTDRDRDLAAAEALQEAIDLRARIGKRGVAPWRLRGSDRSRDRARPGHRPMPFAETPSSAPPRRRESRVRVTSGYRNAKSNAARVPHDPPQRLMRRSRARRESRSDRPAIRDACRSADRHRSPGGTAAPAPPRLLRSRNAIFISRRAALQRT